MFALFLVTQHVFSENGESRDLVTLFYEHYGRLSGTLDPSDESIRGRRVVINVHLERLTKGMLDVSLPVTSLPAVSKCLVLSESGL